LLEVDVERSGDEQHRRPVRPCLAFRMRWYMQVALQYVPVVCLLLAWGRSGL